MGWQNKAILRWFRNLLCRNLRWKKEAGKLSLKSFGNSQESRLSVFVFLAVFFQRVLILQETVIRTAEDVGTILLMDERFLERDNQSLLPEEWESYYAVNRNNCGQVLENFWNGLDNDKVAEAES